MRKKAHICLIGLFLVFLIGCVPKTVIEELAIISARGIDVAEEGQIEKTINYIRFDPQEDNIYATTSGVSKTLKGAREVIARKVGYQLLEGKLKIEIYGKEIAEQGITPYIVSTMRDPHTSEMIKLVVAEDTAKELFYTESNTSDTIGEYLDELLDRGEKVGNIPSSSLQYFARRTGATGQDGTLPIIGLVDGTPTIKKLGVFRDTQLVLELSLTESLLLKFTLDNTKLKNIPLEIDLPIEPIEKYFDRFSLFRVNKKNQEDFAINFLITEGNAKSKMKSTENLSYQTDINLILDLVETTLPLKINKREVTKTLEKEVEKKLEKQLKELLEKTQEANVDPFGYGKLYRIQKKKGVLKGEEWREKYPEITVDYNVNVTIMHAGSLD